jgi:putative oxidoreductase
MLKILNRYESEAFALLRIIAGAMFLFHGAQKLFGFYADMPTATMGSQFWFAGIIEFFGGLLICLGLFSRIAAFITCGEMAVAYFTVHWRLQMNQQFFPTINHGELAVLYCFVFLYIACKGPGKWSLERFL